MKEALHGNIYQLNMNNINNVRHKMKILKKKVFKGKEQKIIREKGTLIQEELPIMKYMGEKKLRLNVQGKEKKTTIKTKQTIKKEWKLITVV